MLHASESVIAVGSVLPEVELTEGNPLTRISLTSICRGKKVIITGAVGAFLPNCSTVHIPSFIARSEELKKKGYREIICVVVNDIFVVEAWAKALQSAGKIRILADPNGEFVKALGLAHESPLLGGVRSKRFTMEVDDNIVKHLSVDPDFTGMSNAAPNKKYLN